MGMTCDAEAQTELLASLASDPDLFRENVDKLRLSDFPSVPVRIVFETLRGHWQKYGCMPGPKVLPAEVLAAMKGTGPDGTPSISTMVPEASVPSVGLCLSKVVPALRAPVANSGDTQYFRDRLREYLSTVRLGAMPGQDMSATEQLEAAARIREEVSQITGGERKGMSTTARRRVVSRRMEQPRRYGTGVWPIDIRMNMGLELGEVGCLLAGSGVGKTNMLINIAANAAMVGQRCLFLTLEVSDEVILRRLHAIMGNFPMSTMNKPEEEWTPEDLTRYDYMLSDAYPNIDFVTVNYEYVDKTPSCDDLDREIGAWRKAMRESGIQDQDAPLVLVDYIRQINPGKLVGRDDNTNTKMGAVMQQLKRMSVKHNCVLWTAQQVQRAANRKEHIRKDDIADSIAIVNHCDAILGFVPVGGVSQGDPTTSESEEDTLENHADKERQMNVDFVKLRNAAETGSFCTVFQGKSLRLWTSESYARMAESMASSSMEAFFSAMRPKTRKSTS